MMNSYKARAYIVCKKEEEASQYIRDYFNNSFMGKMLKEMLKEQEKYLNSLAQKTMNSLGIPKEFLEQK